MLSWRHPSWETKTVSGVGACSDVSDPDEPRAAQPPLLRRGASPPHLQTLEPGVAQHLVSADAWRRHRRKPMSPVPPPAALWQPGNGATAASP